MIRRTLRVRPFIYVVPSTYRTCVVTLACLVAIASCLILTDEKWICALFIGCVLGSVSAALLTQVKRYTFSFIRQRRGALLSSAVEGAVTAMILPSTFPPIEAAILTFIFSLASMGLAPRTSTSSTRSILNVPVLTACTAWIVGGGRDCTGAILPIANALDTAVTDTLNSSVFSIFAVTVPDGYMSLFWKAAETAGSAAEHFNVLTLLSSIILFSCNMADGMVTSLFLFMYLLLVRLAGPIIFGGGDILLAALSGGTLFCAVFVIARPATLPATRTGRAVYALLCGIMAFFVAGVLPTVRGIPFAILCGNVISILIRYFEDLIYDFIAQRKAAIGGEKA